MKFLVVFAVVVACAAAASLGSQASDVNARVIQEAAEINPDGSWNNALQVDNGISQSQQGSLKSVPGAEAPSITVSGSYSQPGENGQLLTVTYIADENGFQPQGDHLPKNP